MKNVIIYTDGCCSGNPGPGGYGVVLLYKNHRKELSGGFRLTTNNRMELMACIVGLDSLKYPCTVTLFSDSHYVVNGITKNWAKTWRSKGWKRSDSKPALNYDLWEKLLNLCDVHQVNVVWVRGHAGNIENERCDQLAKEAMHQQNLPPDIEYERLITC